MPSSREEYSSSSGIKNDQAVLQARDARRRIGVFKALLSNGLLCFHRLLYFASIPADELAALIDNAITKNFENSSLCDSQELR
jgi:hypothetical protein